MHFVFNSFKSAFSGLRSHKMRSFLTMLGIIIGTAAVILVMAVGAGAQSLVLSQIESVGSNIVGILPGKSESNQPPTSVFGVVITTLKYEDVLALQDQNNVPEITSVTGYSRSVGEVIWRDKIYDTNVNGVMSSYLQVEGGTVARGRFFNSQEESDLSRVVVLGSAVAREVFGLSDPMGERIKIKNRFFEVIGVMESRGIVAFQDYDNQILIPIKTAQKVIDGVSHIGMIRARVQTKEDIPMAIKNIEAVLRSRHDIADNTGANDDFTVRSASEALNMLSSVTDALGYFLTAMAALSLLVGGIGIMNIMLISVTERTREIGLRKALGATNKNIAWQFLLEAIILTFLGGFIGILIGSASAFLVAFGAHFFGYEDWRFIVSFEAIFVSLAVSFFVGLIFGFYPARRASILEPIEALRHE